MKKYLKWNIKELLVAIIGILLYSATIKYFINPNHLYSGGIMGFSQILRTLFCSWFNLKTKFDISSIIYYVINIPLFIIAYKNMGKTFFSRTLFCVTLNTLFLMLLPNINNPLTHDILTNILIGGILCGMATGALLSIGASTGGTDIIGILLSKKFKKITVGSVNLSFNIFIYSLSAVVGGIETMIYSVLYSVLDSMTVDRTHLRNVCSNVFIFSKNNPKKIVNFITKDLNRGSTYWEAVGGYSNSKTYIVYTFLTRIEKMQLESVIKNIDKDAFIIMNNGGSVKGNFDKNI